MKKALPGKSRRGDAAAVLAIILFFTLCFWPVVFGGRFFVTSDAFFQSYPLRTVVWDAVSEWRLPLWTPLLLCGYPLLSMAQLGVGYPMTWLYLVLPGHLAEEVYVLAPFLLSPALTYYYARELGRGHTASLLAGLAFAYGGMMAGMNSNNGMMPNSVMWLPLVLVWVERARTRRLPVCLLWAACAYSLSVLNGHGQGFLYAGSVALAYATFLALLPARASREGPRGNGRPHAGRFGPLLAASGAVVSAACVAAFQIFETWAASRLSVRGDMTYEVFGEGSFAAADAAKSLVLPLHYAIDMTAYVSPLACVLAVVAVPFALRGRDADARVLFWLGAAALAWVLMLGANTPLHRLVYHVPFFNRFRMPSHHAFEWTFAVSILSAYGWDALERVASSRVRQAFADVRRRRIVCALAWLLLTGLVGFAWWRAAGQAPPPGSNLYTGLSEASYLQWKALFVLLLSLTIWQGLKVASPSWRAGLLGGAVVAACFVEPYMLISRWWLPAAKPPERFAAVSRTTRYLQQFPPEQGRVYTHVRPFVEEHAASPSLEPLNLTALHGLQNVAGYEPLILERYSRALDNVGKDGFNPRPGFAADRTRFGALSHVLDLLNTGHVVTHADPLNSPGSYVEKDGVRFAAEDEFVGLKPGEAASLSAHGAEGDTLALVTTLAFANEEADGSRVASLRVFTQDGRVVARDLRAGSDTSEWAYDRPDVRAAVRHERAPVFDSREEGVEGGFPAHRYWTRVPLGARLSVERVEVVNTMRKAELALWRASIFDSAGGKSAPLSRMDAGRWRAVYRGDGALILRNERALPRVWLVAEAEAAGAEEALRTIRGESGRPFDPRRTALLEVPESELPALPGGPVRGGAGARLALYEPGRLVVETDAEAAAVLVVSEVNYPGWEARLDGAKVPILTANYLLRGVALPPGRHRVEMWYAAPALRAGAVISALAVLALCLLAVYVRRSSAKN